MAATKTMKAAVVNRPGEPDVLQIQQIPVPVPTPGHVLIRVKACGLNRSEMFTRQGHSPNVRFPRVLGIEAVGVIEDAPGGEFERGTTVATCMGGMGRDWDGGYAEYTCVPARQVQVIIDDHHDARKPSWEILGGMPEMLQTAYGSLFKSLRLQRGDRLLIRGGTTSVGLAAAGLAKAHGVYVASTTRRESARQLLLSAGVDEVIVDNDNDNDNDNEQKLADKIESSNNKFDKVLELIGTLTLHDSLRCVKVGGIVCVTGIVGGQWSLKDVNPMELIPTGVSLTTYAGDNSEFLAMPLNDMVKLVRDGKMKIPIGKVFKLDDIVDAHRTMEANTAGGKIVVVIP